MSSLTALLDEADTFEAGADAEETETEIEAGEVEESAIDARFRSWLPGFEVSGGFERFQLRQLVTESIRIERCQDEQRALQNREAARAKTCWDADRSAEVFAIVSKLARNPERWRNELLRSAQGCRWLIGQWTALLEVLNQGKTWDDRQRSRALDLLGISPLFRDGSTPLDPPQGEDNIESEPGNYLITCVSKEIDTLQTLVERSRTGLDAFERSQAEAALHISFEREMQALRRFEAGCQRRYLQLLKALAPFKRDRETRSNTALKSMHAYRYHSSSHSTELLFNQPHAKVNETERCSPADDRAPAQVATTRFDAPHSPERSSSPRPPAGNRHQRRQAAAMARRQG